LAKAQGFETQRTPEEDLHLFQQKLVTREFTYESYGAHSNYGTPTKSSDSDCSYLFSQTHSTFALDPELNVASANDATVQQSEALNPAAMSSSDYGISQPLDFEQGIQRLLAAAHGSAQGPGIGIQTQCHQRNYFMCYRCNHARPHLEQQSLDVDDSCEYCELHTLDADYIHEAKYCVPGQHKAVRFDFFDAAGMEDSTACLLHRNTPTKADVDEGAHDDEAMLGAGDLGEGDESAEEETFRQSQPKRRV